MSYTPTVWKTGDLVSSPKLNKIENAIAELDSTATELVSDVTQLKSEISEVEAGFPQKSASGSIVSFNDGADNVPVVSLTAEINPVQDLHGFDNPWPAGGGKNLFNKPVREMYGTFAQGSVLYGQLFNTTTAFHLYAYDNEDISLATEYDLGSITTTKKTFTMPADAVLILISSSALSALGDGNMMLSKSDFTKFEPYSNVCPISGWTGVTAYRTGVNVWDEEWRNGFYANGTFTADSSYVASKNLIPVVEGESYYFYRAVTESNIVYVTFYDKSGTYMGNLPSLDEYGRIHISTDPVFTIPSGVGFISFFMARNYGGTYNHDLSINYPSTDTEYHAYTGSVIPIAFPDDVGTVYKAALNVLTGEGLITGIAVQKTIGDATGTEAAGTNTTNYKFSGFFPASIVRANTQKSNICMYDYSSGWVNHFYCYGTSAYFYLPNGMASDTVVQAFAMLETPIPFTVDPNTIKTLYGLNNIWCDTGNVSLTYRADPATYTAEQIQTMLNAMVAPVEASTTASKAYSVNDFLILDNVLYKVISPIANGGTITIDTNVSATTIGAEITAILNT